MAGQCGFTIRPKAPRHQDKIEQKRITRYEHESEEYSLCVALWTRLHPPAPAVVVPGATCGDARAPRIGAAPGGNPGTVCRYFALLADPPPDV